MLKNVSLAAAACIAVVACGPSADNPPGARGRTLTLGQEIYELACTRLGASVLTEDLEGASYRSICTPDSSGKYADVVDTNPLPRTTTAESTETRRLAIAKLEALARRRSDVIRALDTTFDDVDIPVPFENGRTIRNHEALRQFLSALVPLYSQDPNEALSSAEPLLPSVTRAAGRFFASLSGPGDPQRAPADPARAQQAQEALSRIAGRQGYRPLRTILGAIAPVLAYRDFHSFAQSVTTAIGPSGPLHDDFENVLGAVQTELSTSMDTPIAPPLSVDPVILQPNRPRTKIEFAAATFLSSSSSFNVANVSPRFLVARDPRGIARPRDVAMFADADGDGLPDVDPSGRFLSASGGLAALDPPFVTPLFPVVSGFDPSGRAVDSSGQLVYDYVDLSQSLLAATASNLAPLVQSDPSGVRGSITELLRGAFPLWGARVDRSAPWAAGGHYTAFDTSTSPNVDLIHAAGQLAAHPGSDVWLSLVDKALTDYPDVTARLLGAALKIRELSNARPDIALDPKVTFWDEMAGWITAVARNPVLFQGLMHALQDPDLVAVLPKGMSQFMTLRDHLTYNPADVNGPPLNVTTGMVEPPRTPVDRAQPLTGDNRSIWQRSVSMIHDVNGVNACNKDGAQIQADIGGIRLTYPLVGGYAECQLFAFQNMGLLYLDSILGQAKLAVRDPLLGLVASLGGSVTVDQIFEQSSGVTGLSLSPTPAALNRLVFFGAQTSKFDPLFGGAMPDRDPYYTSTNAKTNRFISSLVDAVSTSVCPTRTVLDATLGALDLADCGPSSGGDPNDLLRLRDANVIFAWETNDFIRGMTPFLRPFKDANAGDLFLQLADILNRHWPGPEHGPECSKTGSFLPGTPDYNRKYCAESGVNTYEPLIAQALATDLMPALAAFSTVVEPMQVVDVRRGGASKSAVEILREMVLAFFDPDVSKQFGIVDRNGRADTTWADGVTPKAQVTPFDLFAMALQKNDDLLKGTDRFAGWRRARSTLVDVFFSVTGQGATATFQNPATVPALRTLVRTIREQINANCPDRETSQTRCDWAVRAMAANAADTIGAPDFSTILGLVDALLTDPTLRPAVEALLEHLTSEIDPATVQATLTSTGDLFQLLGDTETLPPIYRAISGAADPATSAAPPGAADRIVTLLRTLVNETGPDGNPQPNPYDPYRCFPRILANAVSPIDPSDPTSASPIEVLLDTIAEVNRIDASAAAYEPLSASDYQAVFATMRDFMTDSSRGLEQVYRIVAGRGYR